MTNRKFYKTTFKVEVLSEEPIPEGMELDTVMEEATGGGYSAECTRETNVELNGLEAATALFKQASHPSFFRLDENGEDVER